MMSILSSEEIEVYFFVRNKLKWFQFIPKERENAFEDFDINQREVDKEFKENYNKNILPNVKKNEFEFIREIQNEMPEMIIEIKRNQIEELSREIVKITSYFQELEWRKIDAKLIRLLKVFFRNPDILIKQVKKLNSDIYFLENKNKIKQEEITEYEIVRAKEYPIENLIEVNQQGFAHCPFHQEKTASFFIKQNFGYCFGCGKSVDTIQLLMDTKQISFIESVKLLNKL